MKPVREASYPLYLKTIAQPAGRMKKSAQSKELALTKKILMGGAEDMDL